MVIEKKMFIVTHRCEFAVVEKLYNCEGLKLCDWNETEFNSGRNYPTLENI